MNYKIVLLFCVLAFVAGGLLSFGFSINMLRSMIHEPLSETWRAYDAEEDAQFARANQLLYTRWAEVCEGLVGRLEDERQWVRRRSAGNLCGWGMTQWIPLHVLPLLEDADPEVQVEAARTLASWGYLPALNVLADKVGEKGPDGLARASLEYLCPQGPKAKGKMSPQEISEKWKFWLSENLVYLHCEKRGDVEFLVDELAKKHEVPAWLWAFIDRGAKSKWDGLSESERTDAVLDACDKVAVGYPVADVSVYANARR